MQKEKQSERLGTSETEVGAHLKAKQSLRCQRTTYQAEYWKYHGLNSIVGEVDFAILKWKN